MENKNLARLGPDETVPPVMPDGVSMMVEAKANGKVYVEGANGAKREIVEGASITTGTLTALWTADNTSMPYLKQGSIVMINVADVARASGETSLVFVPSDLRPSVQRKFVIYENSEVEKAMYGTVSPNGDISISGAGDDYTLQGTITYFI